MIDIEKIKQDIQDGYPTHPDDVLGLIAKLEASNKHVTWLALTVMGEWPSDHEEYIYAEKALKEIEQ